MISIYTIDKMLHHAGTVTYLSSSEHDFEESLQELFISFHAKKKKKEGITIQVMMPMHFHSIPKVFCSSQLTCLIKRDINALLLLNQSH